ncbi:MAG: GNAT family N-acetyltransferase [Motiliproteus sp.]
MTPIIRQYVKQDLADLMSAWENASALAHPFLTAEFQDKVRQDIPSLYLPNADTWVAEVNGVVVGFVALLGNNVGALFVEPPFHRKGVGKALMDKAQAIHGDLEVEVFKANSLGRAFYSRYGFELLAETVHQETGNQVLQLKFSA